MENKKRVYLESWLQNPANKWDAEDPASCGARGCFSELSSKDIHDKEIAENGNYEKRKEKIFEETSGRGHGAVLDQSYFLFSMDNITRMSTLFLCAPQYASHLQQSLRRATAERGFHLPVSLEESLAQVLMRMQFDLYEKMQKDNVPAEDARFILPLNTKTTIQTALDARELMHLDYMSKRKGMPEEVRETVSEMINLAKGIAPRLMKERANNYEVLAWMPAPQLFSLENKGIETIIDLEEIDKANLINHSDIYFPAEIIRKAIMERDEAELANLKHYHFTFITGMSLATFHQATRQRTWDQSVQSIYDAVKREEYVIPPSIAKSKWLRAYKNLTEESIKFVKNNFSNSDSLGVLPHSLKVYDLIHVNGWNAIHSIGKRTCTEAQWEIRKIAKTMAEKIKEVAPELGKFAVPQGVLYGKCPEKKSCGVCEKMIEKSYP